MESKAARLCSFGSFRYLSSACRYAGTQLRSEVSVSVRYRPTTSMSVVAGASVNDCDTMRTGGVDACGGGVGTGSEVRLGVGSTGVAGAAVDVCAAVAAIVGAGERVSPGTVTGPVHAPTTNTASTTARGRVTPLRYPTLLACRLVEEGAARLPRSDARVGQELSHLLRTAAGNSDLCSPLQRLNT